MKNDERPKNRYEVTVKGRVYVCQTIQTAATIVKFVSPRVSYVVRYDADGKNIPMNQEEYDIIEDACPQETMS